MRFGQVAAVLLGLLQAIESFGGLADLAQDLLPFLFQFVVLEPQQCIALLDQLIALHQQLHDRTVAVDEDILPLDRLQRAVRLEIEVRADQEEREQDGQDDPAHGQRLGQVAPLDQHGRLANGPPHRHQEDAVIVQRVGQGARAVFVDEVDAGLEDLARQIGLDLFDNQRAEDLALDVRFADQFRVAPAPRHASSGLPGLRSGRTITFLA